MNVFSYPRAPWRLRGVSVQTLKLVEVRRVRQFVPAGVRIVPVLPGRTIAVMYCARYGSGSSLIYSELAVAPALIEWRSRIGFWISHIYVDNPDSVAGGRRIWHLPKQIASFSWNPARRQVAVTAGSSTLCRIGWEAGTPRLAVPLIAPVLVEDARIFWLRGRCRLTRCRAEVAADRDSPMTKLDFTASRHILVADDLTLTIPAPGRAP